MKILDSEGRELPAGEIGEVFMMPPGGQGSTYRYLGATARAQLVEKVVDVAFHGADRDYQLLCDVLIGKSRRNQLQHFTLPRG